MIVLTESNKSKVNESKSEHFDAMMLFFLGNYEGRSNQNPPGDGRTQSSNPKINHRWRWRHLQSQIRISSEN